MGCDGCWETMSNQKIINFVNNGLKSQTSLKDINC